MNHQVSVNFSSQMVEYLSEDGSNRHHHGGIPPSCPHSQRPPILPHSQHSPMASPLQQKPGSRNNMTMGSKHSRSLSQPSFFSVNHLSPLIPPSPLMDCSSNLFLDQSASTNVSMVERAMSNSSQTPPIPSTAPFGRVNDNAILINEGLPLHQRQRWSDSDIPTGFSSFQQQPLLSLMQFGYQMFPDKTADALLENFRIDGPTQLIKGDREWSLSGNSSGEGACKMKLVSEDDLFSVFMNLDVWNSSSMEEKDLDNSRASGTMTSGSSENEIKSSAGNSHNICRITSMINSSEKRGKKKCCW